MIGFLIFAENQLQKYIILTRFVHQGNLHQWETSMNSDAFVNTTARSKMLKSDNKQHLHNGHTTSMSPPLSLWQIF